MWGNFLGWGLPLHYQPPSLEVGELGLWAVTAGWDDPSGSSRAPGALKGPPAWAQPHAWRPGDAREGQAVSMDSSALGLCLAKKKKGVNAEGVS